jgi:hypothetical protein
VDELSRASDRAFQAGGAAERKILYRTSFKRNSLADKKARTPPQINREVQAKATSPDTSAVALMAHTGTTKVDMSAINLAMTKRFRLTEDARSWSDEPQELGDEAAAYQRQLLLEPTAHTASSTKNTLDDAAAREKSLRCASNLVPVSRAVAADEATVSAEDEKSWAALTAYTVLLMRLRRRKSHKTSLDQEAAVDNAAKKPFEAETAAYYSQQLTQEAAAREAVGTV